MGMTMLAYFKLILQKVSFDPLLFEKELKKAVKHLHPDEIKELVSWAQMNFGEQISEIISNWDIFK